VKETRTYTTKELNIDTWPDFEKLAPQQGQCWCMYYHRARPVLRGASREEREAVNKKDKKNLVREGRSHSVLVYHDRKLVGWCQYGSKEELPRIDAGRNYRKLTPLAVDKKLWRITCFYVDREYRKKGVAKTALRAALDSSMKQGRGTDEAHPVVSRKIAGTPEWLWVGTPGMFRRERFRPVSPLGTSLFLMRKTINP